MGKMCPYCGKGDESNCLLVQRDEAFGDKNALYMDSYIWATGDKPHISVGVCLFDHDIMSARIPINYCPICGRKLMKASPMGEWISVNDRLPEEGQYVLVYGDSEIELGRYAPGFDCDSDFYHFWDGTKDTIYSVTHWQPLPAPPYN